MKIYRAVLFAGWAAGTVFWGSEALARGFLPDSEIPQKEMRERISVINPGSEVTNRNTAGADSESGFSVLFPELRAGAVRPVLISRNYSRPKPRPKPKEESRPYDECDYCDDCDDPDCEECEECEE